MVSGKTCFFWFVVVVSGCFSETISSGLSRHLYRDV